MLAIVRIALSRPYTFIVAALLILIVGTLTALRLPVDARFDLGDAAKAAAASAVPGRLGKIALTA